MKKIYLLALMFHCILMVFAQSVRYPFVEEGKFWVIENGIVGGDYSQGDTAYYKLEGDTLIDNEKWKKFYYATQVSSWYYCGAMQEHGGEVWFLPREGERAYLLYAFPPRGQIICLFGGHKGYVAPTFYGRIREVAQSNIGKSKENRIKWEVEIRTLKGDAKETWIEGVGSLIGPPFNWMPLDINGMGTSRLISCSVRGRMDYLLGLSTPSIVKEDREVLHSLDGKRLATPPQQGIYLRNGKKVVK